MEIVDLYNKRKELTGKFCERKNVPENYYRLSIHIWIINDKEEILIQQRSSNRTMFPNMWANTGGASLKGETSLETVTRELKEELNVNVNIENLTFISSYIRKKDYVDVWLLNQIIELKDLKLQVEEVQDVKWATIDEIEQLINQNKFVKSSWEYLKLHLTNL